MYRIRVALLPMAVPHWLTVRVSLLAFIALLALIGVSPASAQTCYRPGVWQDNGHSASTLSAVAQSWVAARNIANTSETWAYQSCDVPTSAAAANCSFSVLRHSDSFRYTQQKGFAFVCASGGFALMHQGTPQCQVTGTACNTPVPPTCPSAGEAPPGNAGSYTWTGGSAQSFCFNGCTYTASMVGSLGGVRTADAENVSSTGQACMEAQTAPPPGTSRPERLQPGQCPGTVNGQPVIVPCSSTTSTNSTTTGSTTASGPSGGGTSTSSQTTSTSCTGAGSCTTTTTTTVNNPDGSTEVREEATTEDRDSLCARQPENPQCSPQRSSISGTCSAVTCTGDAVQCAIAREQARRNCQLFEGDTSQSQAANAAVAAGDRPSFHPASQGETVALDLHTRLTTTPMFGASGTCPADVTVGGYVLPFSAMCPNLNVLGVALMALSWLIAAFIVFRKGV